MMTFYSDDVEHAKIAYYTNEKKNAIAPKVTDQGADGVSSQVNQVFAETLSEVALGLASALSGLRRRGGRERAHRRAGEPYRRRGHARGQGGSSVLGTYSSVLGSAQGLIEDSGVPARPGALIRRWGGLVGRRHQGRGGRCGLRHGRFRVGAFDGFAAKRAKLRRRGRLDGCGVRFRLVACGRVVFAAACGGRQGGGPGGRLSRYRGAARGGEAFAARRRPNRRSTPLIARLNASIALQEQLRDSLYAAADDIDAGSADTQAKRDEIKALAARRRTASPTRRPITTRSSSPTSRRWPKRCRTRVRRFPRRHPCSMMRVPTLSGRPIRWRRAWETRKASSTPLRTTCPHRGSA